MLDLSEIKLIIKYAFEKGVTRNPFGVVVPLSADSISALLDQTDEVNRTALETYKVSKINDNNKQINSLQSDVNTNLPGKISTLEEENTTLISTLSDDAKKLIVS